MLELGHIYDRIIETAILIVLLVEYFYGRSDADLKKEEKRRAKKKQPEYEHLTVGEGK